MFDSLGSDVRHAVRVLRQRPLITVVAAVSLALGVGVNTAIYSVFDRLLLARLPVPSPGELVNLTSPGPRTGNVSTSDAGDAASVFSYPLFRDVERFQTPFTAVGGFREVAANLAYHGETTSASGLVVSGGYFPALAVRPALGRLLTSDDDRDGASAVVVLNHRYWTTRFAANPAVLNDTLTVNGVPMTIVGVGPPGFESTTTLEAERFYVPLQQAARITRWRDRTERRDWWIYAIARLKPGISRAQAEAALAPPFTAVVRDVDYPAQRGLSERARDAYLTRRLLLEDGSRGQDGDRDDTRAVLLLLFTITGFILLIACANVANLLLSRAAERSGEMAVRLAIGASAPRLVRLLFVESLLLALLGGVGALMVARLTMLGVLALMPADDAALLAFDLSVPVLLFTAAASLATACLFGVAPAAQALRATPALTASVLTRSTGTRGTSRLRALLAGSQVALATALLAVAGLLVVSLTNLATADLGIRRSGLSVFRIAPVLNGYSSPRSLALFDQVEGALAATPGVVSVSGATVRLLDDSASATNVVVSGFAAPPESDVRAQYTNVGARYFATLGIPLIAGREFTAADADGAPPVAIVNEAFARKFKLGRDVVGARMGTRAGSAPDIEIVGLVADATYNDAREAPPAQYFRPYRQASTGTLSFYVRTTPGLDPSALLTAIPAVVRRFDANLPVEDLRTMDEQFDESTTPERVVMTLSSSLSMLATVLAAVGLYAVLAYSVSQRRREIGVRVALGARSTDVSRMVFGQTLRLALTATVAGLALAVALGTLGRAMLFEVSAFEPRALAGAGALMLAVALAAGFVPARRAASINPVDALRAD